MRKKKWRLFIRGVREEGEIKIRKIRKRETGESNQKPEKERKNSMKLLSSPSFSIIPHS